MDIEQIKTTIDRVVADLDDAKGAMVSQAGYDEAAFLRKLTNHCKDEVARIEAEQALSEFEVWNAKQPVHGLAGITPWIEVEAKVNRKSGWDAAIEVAMAEFSHGPPEGAMLSERAIRTYLRTLFSSFKAQPNKEETND